MIDETAPAVLRRAAPQDRLPGAPEALRILTPGSAEAEGGAQVYAATEETYR
ncbi:hypothetical protein OG698_39510 [Streptomyces sp. NBC_01003]|uniref:hypothetical protein n=1 Tax=Streptomyces sp. NBC_01003 TaxID=2903714 RepID=UPI003868634A|nr:hypothetical protein OG698_39510 [Streptomyces sp. NBC_01003]